MKTLPIYYGAQRVGELLQNENGFCELTYDPQWQQEGFDISVTLPRSQQHYTGDCVRSFFENLLPEAGIRESLARHYQVSTENVFGLLKYIGLDCAGAFSIGGPGAAGTYTPLSVQELQTELEQLPTLPMAARRSGTSLSLAGAQHKLPLFRKDGVYYLPQGGAASNCIIKLPIPSFSHSVLNEYFCMQLAQRCGLPTPNTEMLTLPQFAVLVIERYDRSGMDFHPIRLPQEDFCQLSGLSSAVKYESEGGPGIRDCADLIRRYSLRPAKDLLLLVQWAAFNLCIGNNDAHAKNLSMLRQGNSLQLAPFYDLLSTTYYGRKLQKKLAMRIGGQQWSHYVSRRRWELMAQEIGLSPKSVIKQAETVALSVLQVLPQAAQACVDGGADAAAVHSLQRHIAQRTQSVQAQIK